MNTCLQTIYSTPSQCNPNQRLMKDVGSLLQMVGSQVNPSTLSQIMGSALSTDTYHPKRLLPEKD